MIKLLPFFIILLVACDEKGNEKSIPPNLYPLGYSDYILKTAKEVYYKNSDLDNAVSALGNNTTYTILSPPSGSTYKIGLFPKAA